MIDFGKPGWFNGYQEKIFLNLKSQFIRGGFTLKIGEIYEELLFGKCPKQDYSNNRWECFKEIIKARGQPGTIFTEALCEDVKKELGVVDDVVEFFSTLKTPLDSNQGIDGFVIWWLDEGFNNAKIVTFDITVRLEKKTYKSDFLITPHKLIYINPFIRSIAWFLKEKTELFYNYY
ncbi:hypothetical protein KKC45_00905 [Patescibacteria group bacterium]|nr:hypothetical protein [Patescibacteria group bacterium]